MALVLNLASLIYGAAFWSRNVRREMADAARTEKGGKITVLSIAGLIGRAIQLTGNRAGRQGLKIPQVHQVSAAFRQSAQADVQGG
mgnify:CR=1 FL=1